MIRKTLGIALAVAVTPLALEAQVPEQAQARIDAAMERVAERGVPASLVQSKIAEGRAKGIPADRVAQAAERRAEALVRAQDAFTRGGVEPRAGDLSVGADAIQGGVSEAALASIAARAPQDRRMVAVDVLRELVGMGMPVNEALGRVVVATERGADALANLPAQAAEAMGRRGPPAGVGPGQAGPPASAGPPSGVPASAGGAETRRGPPEGRGGPPEGRGGPPSL